jgi:hypothetical protein
MDRKDAMSAAVDLLATIVRNIRLRRELSKACPEPHLNFWRVIYGNCTDTAVQDWCKLFGADGGGNQTLHWKTLATDEDQFRQDLLKALGVNEDQWVANWHEIKTYRDMAVAHFDPRRVSIKTYPKFDLALESAYFYYDYLRAELAKVGVTQMPASLRVYSDDFANQSRDIAKAALNATKGFEEKVR